MDSALSVQAALDQILPPGAVGFAATMANLTAWSAPESWDENQPVDLDFSYVREL